MNAIEQTQATPDFWPDDNEIIDSLSLNDVKGLILKTLKDLDYNENLQGVIRVNEHWIMGLDIHLNVNAWLDKPDNLLEDSVMFFTKFIGKRSPSLNNCLLRTEWDDIGLGSRRLVLKYLKYDLPRLVENVR